MREENKVDFSIIRRLFHYDMDCGYSDNEILLLVNRIGQIPKVLCEYYKQLGKFEDVNYAQDHLSSLDRLCIKDGYLVFFEENQGGMFWCIKEQDLTLDNPPVYVKKRENGKDIYLLENSSLIEFFNAMAYAQALFCFPYNSGGHIECGEVTKQSIKMNFIEKSFGFLESPVITFYGNDDDEVLAIMGRKGSESYALMFACTTEEQYNRIVNFMFSLPQQE